VRQVSFLSCYLWFVQPTFFEKQGHLFDVQQWLNLVGQGLSVTWLTEHPSKTEWQSKIDLTLHSFKKKKKGNKVKKKCVLAKNLQHIL
jgi:hypothetical protein